MATFDGEMGETIELADVPAEYKDKVEELRTNIIEAACDFDDALAEKFLNEEEISLKKLKLHCVKV